MFRLDDDVQVLFSEEPGFEMLTGC